MPSWASACVCDISKSAVISYDDANGANSADDFVHVRFYDNADVVALVTVSKVVKKAERLNANVKVLQSWKEKVAGNVRIFVPRHFGEYDYYFELQKGKTYVLFLARRGSKEFEAGFCMGNPVEGKERVAERVQWLNSHSERLDSHSRKM